MRIVIADSEELYLHSMRFVCATEFGHEVIALAADGESAVREAIKLRPDVLLLELDLPKLDGFGIIQKVRPACPLTSIIAVTSCRGSFTILRVERAGFDGYLDKGSNSLSGLRHALAAAAQGRRYFSPAFHAIRDARIRDSSSFDKILSDRELQVLALIGHSLNDDEIGANLGISARTAETFRHRILKKMRVAGTPKLIRLATELGFTQIPELKP